MRAIRAYRLAHESLRAQAAPGEDLAERQIYLAAASAGLGTDVVRSAVEHWMEREPLDLLAGAILPDLREFLETARLRSLRIGAVSDYPPHAKLSALGVSEYFDVVVCAQDRTVQELKPSPAGLLFALRQLGVDPANAVYIGDRPELDGEAAERAGMPFIIISPGDSYRDVSKRLGMPLPEV